jgi:hypothetical protein
MSYWILTITGHVISWTTVQHVTNLELSTDEVKVKCKEYAQQVTDLLKDANHVIPQDGGLQIQDWNEFPVEDDPDFIEEFQHVVSDLEVPDKDGNFTLDAFNDTYLNMEIALPCGGGDPEDMQFAKVTKRL